MENNDTMKLSKNRPKAGQRRIEYHSLRRFSLGNVDPKIFKIRDQDAFFPDVIIIETKTFAWPKYLTAVETMD